MLTTSAAELDEATVQKFRAGLRGALLRPGDTQYDTARLLWNGLVERRPALIVRCAGTADVIHSLAFARRHALPLTVRGGGNNVTGRALCDNGLTLDVSLMKGVRVDPAGRSVRLEAGLTWGELDHETQAFGLATTGAHISTTGVVGVTLGGGYGWLMRKYGLAADNLVSADLVTADGRLLYASAESQPDLLWALRGGGGNFGVVTSAEYRLHPVGPLVFGGMAFYAAERTAEVLRFYRELTRRAPDELTVLATLCTAPPAPFVPAELRGAPVAALAVCHCGSPEAAQRDLAPLRALGPLVDRIGPIPYTRLQRLFDAAGVFGRCVHVRSDHLAALNDDLIDTVAQHFAGITSPLSVVMISALGGAVARVDEHATAFGHRRTAYDIAITAMWTDPRETVLHRGWADQLWEELRPHSTGVYVNELGDEGEERLRAAYHPASFARLAALKQRYDPDNLFRPSQNIRPTV
ncbi:MAG TPA: FAD-binding oxidoreductase [Roseiflexaceae bacterium]|nr:FAD-binding oxidoreductase [Roseiflexaceae bacterium]